MLHQCRYSRSCVERSIAYHWLVCLCVQTSPAILGLALTHVLQLTGMLQWWVRQTAEVENTMTSVERMLEYTTLEQEPPT